MEIERKGNIIDVHDSVIKMEDSELIKSEIQAAIAEGSKGVELVFHDAISFNSAIIGYLIKLVRVDKVQIHIVAKNYKLHELLHNLSLTDMLNVTRS